MQRFKIRNRYEPVHEIEFVMNFGQFMANKLAWTFHKLLSGHAPRVLGVELPRGSTNCRPNSVLQWECIRLTLESNTRAEISWPGWEVSNDRRLGDRRSSDIPGERCDPGNSGLCPRSAPVIIGGSQFHSMREPLQRRDWSLPNWDPFLNWEKIDSVDREQSPGHNAGSNIPVDFLNARIRGLKVCGFFLTIWWLQSYTSKSML